MRTAVAICVVLLAGAAIVSGLSEKWDEENNPASFDSNDNFVYNFSAIPTSGALGEGVGWSDTYWPSYKSGIAHRWYAEDPQDYKYHLYNLEELKNLTIDQLKELSPGEKYDIFIGRYDYPIVHTEWKRTSSEDPTWEGICHGWAPASIFYKEPNPVTLTSVDGIEVPFGSSDVKALLSYYAGQYDRAETAFIGRRCNTDLNQHPEAANSSECIDLHAASFFLVLSNMISTEKTGFVVDRDRGDQVWNQPVTSYSFTFDESPTNFDDAANRTVDVSMIMTYVVETQPEWEAHEPYLTSTRYYFHLNLDKEDNIIGGDYYNFRSNRVDFAWSSKISDFFGYFEQLKEVYVASTNDSRPTLGEFFVTDFEQRAFDNVLTQDGSFFYLEPYGENHRQAWSIAAEEGVEEIEITFLWIDVTKYDDTIRIYEEADGTGALVSVLHGEYEEATVVRVKASGAFILFKSSAFTNGRGFHATYRFITESATI